jgi:putative transposase
MPGYGLLSIESVNKEVIVVGIRISFERNMLIAEQFLTKRLGKEIRKASNQFLQMAELGIYPQACNFLKITYHLHSAYEKSNIIERTIQYIKDRTEMFDDYFPCRKDNCKLVHITNWLKLFVDMYNQIQRTGPVSPTSPFIHVLPQRRTSVRRVYIS